MADRLDAVLEAIYAAFSAGWDGMDTPGAVDTLTNEAMWLARLLTALLPNEPEPKGLLALMLYCAARHRARRDADGRFVPLDQQNAALWDRDRIIEAEDLLTRATQAARFGRFQCEAAIQSVHIQRPITGRLNLRALRTLYDLLVTQTGGIGASIGRAVVIAQAGEPAAALADLEALPVQRVSQHQPWWVARAHIAALAGNDDLRRASLTQALDLTLDPAVREFLSQQLATPRD